MKPHRPLLLVISFLFCITTSFAEEAKNKSADNASPPPVASSLSSYVFEDPHGEEKTIRPDTRLVLMSFDMELSKGIHKFLEKKDANYLKEHRAEYVADISPMPAVITWLFAGPKMRRYSFPMLLADDDAFAENYPKKEGKISVIQLDDNRTIRDVAFLGSMKEVEETFFKAPTVSNMADQLSSIQGSKP